jgi:hypothetical protein
VLAATCLRLPSVEPGPVGSDAAGVLVLEEELALPGVAPRALARVIEHAYGGAAAVLAAEREEEAVRSGGREQLEGHGEAAELLLAACVLGVTVLAAQSTAALGRHLSAANVCQVVGLLALLERLAPAGFRRGGPMGPDEEDVTADADEAGGGSHRR